MMNVSSTNVAHTWDSRGLPAGFNTQAYASPVLPHLDGKNDAQRFALSSIPLAVQQQSLPDRRASMRRNVRPPRKMNDSDEDDDVDEEVDADEELYDFDETLYKDKLLALLAACRAVDRAAGKTRAGRRPKATLKFASSSAGVKRPKPFIPRRAVRPRHGNGEEDDRLAELLASEDYLRALRETKDVDEAADLWFDWLAANQRHHDLLQGLQKLVGEDLFSQVSPPLRSALHNSLEDARLKAIQLRNVAAQAHAMVARARDGMPDGALRQHRVRVLAIIEDNLGQPPPN